MSYLLLRQLYSCFIILRLTSPIAKGTKSLRTIIKLSLFHRSAFFFKNNVNFRTILFINISSYFRYFMSHREGSKNQSKRFSRASGSSVHTSVFADTASVTLQCTEMWHSKHTDKLIHLAITSKIM